MFNNASVSSLINFNEDTGNILLKDHRMILIGANAFGSLRRELIQAVGMDRAKTILLRYGRKDGSETADNLRKVFPNESAKELFYAGPQIHKLTGSVLAQIIQLTYNHNTGEYYGEGKLFHSFEAEQHLKHIGRSTEPVCHTVTGFIGGYASKYYGRDIVVREIKCKAKGDPYCYYVAKPAGEWSTDILYDELGEYVNSHVDSALLESEKQKNELEKILKLNNQLSATLLDNRGLSSVTEILGQTLELAVIIEDKQFNLIESYSLFKNHDLSNIIRLQKPTTLYHQLEEKTEPIHFTISEGVGWVHERLVSPIYTKRGLFGFISLIKEDGNFSQYEKRALELATTICSIQLLQDMTVIETENRLKEQLINDLLDEHNNMDELIYRSRLMGYELDRPHYLLLLSLHNKNQLTSKVPETIIHEIKNVVSNTLNLHLQSFDINNQWLIAFKEDKFLILCPQEVIQSLDMNIHSFAQLLAKSIQQKMKEVIIGIGIGTLCKTLKEIKRGYDEAQIAIKLASNNKTINIIAFEDLDSFSRLFSVGNTQELTTLANSILENLRNYDDKNNSELLTTLYHFLENQGNLQRTSEDLLLSLGAVRYRIKRIQEICKLDFTKAKDFYEAYLAMQIYMYLGNFNLK